jgi:hypothetical protein
MKRVALISTVMMGVGFAHRALAADLPVRAAPVYQAPVVVAPTWTGLYRRQRRLGLGIEFQCVLDLL